MHPPRATTSPTPYANTTNDTSETLPPINVRRLLSYVRPYLPRLGIAFIALLITTSIGLVFPYVIQKLIDGVLKTQDMDMLNTIAIGLVILFIMRFFSGYIETYMLEYIGERVVVDIRGQLYSHLLRLPANFFANRRTGEIVSRLASDVTLVRTALTNNMATIISQILTLIGAIIIITTINWRMTLFILALSPPIGLISALFGRMVRRISTEIQDELANSSTIVEEVIQSIRVVKSFVREVYETTRYNQAIEKTFQAAMRLTRVRAAFGPLTFSLTFLAIVGVLWYGGREVIAGRLTAGGLTSFLFYLMFVAGSFAAFTSIYSQIQEALGATRRIFEILDTKPAIEDKPDAQTLDHIAGQITFDQVSFSYDNRVMVLQNLCLTIQPGEVLALVGPSGAGKSTFFQLIPRFYDPTQGRVLLDGHDLRDVKQHNLREHIGIVPQETLLFSGTIRENIIYGDLNATEEEIIEAAKAANAHDFITALPDGYESLVGERGIKLSGGQRQRISIARAILKNPRILLLDEATSSLDSESEGLVQEALERLMKTRTTLVIAHRLSTVRNADRIAVLESGKLVEMGNHEELLKKDGLYGRLYAMQFESSSQDWGIAYCLLPTMNEG